MPFPVPLLESQINAFLAPEILSEIFLGANQAERLEGWEEIFNHSRDSGSNLDRPRRGITGLPTRVSHVCHYWREVAISTPQLWASIDITDWSPFSSTKQAEWLRRSKSSPLDMFVNCERASILSERSSGFYDWLLSNQAKFQLQNIWLRGLSDLETSVPILRICFCPRLGKNLESFKARGVRFDGLSPLRWAESVVTLPPIWGGATAKLTKIVLADVIIGMSLLNEILTASVLTLESLTLDAVCGVDDDDGNTPAPLLSSLRNLQVVAAEYEHFSFKHFRSIIAFSPTLRDISIHHTWDKDFPLALPNILQGGEHIFSNVENLSLCGHFDASNYVYCRNLFAAFPSVIRLELDLHTWQFGFIFVLQSSSTQSVVLLPCLQSIVVRNVPCAEALAGSLESIAAFRSSTGYPIPRWRVHGIFSSPDEQAEFDKSIKKRKHQLDESP